MKEQQETTELWKPEEETLSERAQLWMDRQVDTAWRTAVSSAAQRLESQALGVVALLKYAAPAEGGRWEFLMTAQPEVQENEAGGSLTEQLCRSLWTTALLFCGRELLREELRARARKKTPWANIGPMEGPGLGTVPLSEMEGLYCRLDGGRIGVTINAFGVLLPEASCGGWFAEYAADEGVPFRQEDCPAGSGCTFCGRQAHCKKVYCGKAHCGKAQTAAEQRKERWQP